MAYLSKQRLSYFLNEWHYPRGMKKLQDKITTTIGMNPIILLVHSHGGLINMYHCRREELMDYLRLPEFKRITEFRHVFQNNCWRNENDPRVP